MSNGKAKKDTYRKKAEKSQLSVSLEDLGIREKEAEYLRSDVKISPNDFMDLVVYTPTKQSHLGRKFSDYQKLSNNTTDEFLKKFIRAADIDQALLFSRFRPGKPRKKTNYDNNQPFEDLLVAFKSDFSSNSTLLCLYAPSGIKESLFSSIRNAIAHGNILHFQNSFVFYSISTKDSESDEYNNVNSKKNEYNKNITFLLKLRKLDKLKAFYETLSEYE